MLILNTRTNNFRIPRLKNISEHSWRPTHIKVFGCQTVSLGIGNLSTQRVHDRDKLIFGVSTALNTPYYSIEYVFRITKCDIRLQQLKCTVHTCIFYRPDIKFSLSPEYSNLNMYTTHYSNSK